MGKPSAPQPPDPNVTIPAQTASNVETATAQSFLNHQNSTSPFGTVNYNQTGWQDVNGNMVPRWEQVTSLSPEQQNLYNATTGVEQQALNTAGQGFSNAQGALGQPFTLDGVTPLASGVQQPGVQTGYQTVGPQFAPNATTAPLQTDIGSAGPIQSRLRTDTLPRLPGVNDFGAERQRVEDAYLGRFNTDIANQQADTESRLNAEGLQRGTEAWNQAQDALNRERVDARNAAIQAGGAEQSRLFGLASQARGQLFGENLAGGQFGNQAQAQRYAQNLASGQFGNQAQAQQFGQNQSLADFYNQAANQYNATNQGQAGFYNTAGAQDFQQQLQNAALQNAARQQGISEQQLIRSQPINELATLLGLGGQIQTPQAAPNFGIGIQPTDVLGAYGQQYGGQMNNYNQQMAARNGLFGGLSNLGGALGSAWILSDARYKKIIRKIGETSKKIPVYLFNYIGSKKPEVGVMAQEVFGIIPDAVKEEHGVLFVDYSRVT